MSAIRAQSASEPATADHADRPCPIRVPGSARTYEVRDALRGMGLRWDPATHAWHGTLPGAGRAFLERAYGLRTQPVVPIGAFQGGAATAAPSLPPRPPTGPRGPNVRDSSRTRAEARVVYRDAEEDAEEIATPTRRFSLLEITSGLPDDSREAEEREAERRLRDLRGRAKAARAAISSTPGLGDVLAKNWGKEVTFYARFGITQTQFRAGGARRGGARGRGPRGRGAVEGGSGRGGEGAGGRVSYPLGDAGLGVPSRGWGRSGRRVGFRPPAWVHARLRGKAE